MRSLIILFLIVLSCQIQAQSSVEFGLLPSFNLNKKLKNNWSLNFKTESRQILYQDEINYTYRLTDPTFALAKKIRSNTTLVGAYLMRIEEGEIIHRSIQQVNILSKQSNFKLAHRIATDQTFEQHLPLEWRIRYRISLEIPLSGKTLDLKEYYLKVNHENLNAFREKEHDLELRALAYVGYTLNLGQKIELGLDYRADRFLENSLRSRIWFGFSFYQSI